jgi:hypothetical protein
VPVGPARSADGQRRPGRLRCGSTSCQHGEHSCFCGSQTLLACVNPFAIRLTMRQVEGGGQVAGRRIRSPRVEYPAAFCPCFC